MDTSLLLQPNRDSKALDFFNSVKVKRELETKLKSLHGKTESELWIYFDSGASRSAESPIRKHLKEIVPAYGSCSVGNGAPLQYIETVSFDSRHSSLARKFLDPPRSHIRFIKLVALSATLVVQFAIRFYHFNRVKVHTPLQTNSWTH